MNKRAKNLRGMICFFLAFVMFVNFPGVVAFAEEPENTVNWGDTVEPYTTEEDAQDANEAESVDPDEMVTVIVELGNSGTATGIQAMSAGGRESVKNKIRNIVSKERTTFSAMSDVQFGFDYDLVMNGFSLEIQRKHLDSIAEIPGVCNVFIAQKYYLPEEELPEEDSPKNFVPNAFEDETVFAIEEDESSVLQDAEEASFEDIESSVSQIIEDFEEFSDVSETADTEVQEGLPIEENATYQNDNIRTEMGVTGAGYNGKGTLVAVLDTSFEVAHEVFSSGVSGGGAKYTSANITSLKNSNSKLKGIYISEKIPYSYDYADGDTVVSPASTNASSRSDHGTHVAGILGANGGGRILGIAPGAQLAVMKIFDNNGASNDAIIFAALEGAMLLNADVINASVGALAGFSGVSNSTYQKVNDNIAAKGIPFVAAAGNTKSSSAGNFANGKTALTDPDDAITGSPASYTESIAVGNAVSATQMNDSSSRGITLDMQIKPEIVAIGTMVYSSSYLGSYVYKQGTSMSTPIISGMYACMKEYLKVKYPSKSAQEICELATNILMSTSSPVEGISASYSPRHQGSGLANLKNAVDSNSYLSVTDKVTGQKRAKANLRDNKDGAFEFKFDVNNLSDTARTYTFSQKALVQSFDTTYFLDQFVDYAKSGQITVSYSGSGVSGNQVTVPKNGKIEVTVKIQLTTTLKNSLKSAVNGIFIEGFINLNSTNGDVNLSLPYVGFYGDWGKPPVFDAAEYTDKTVKMFASRVLNTADEAVSPGANLLKASALRTVNGSRFAINPNGPVKGITTRTGTLRSAEKLVYKAVNKKTGEVVYEANVSNILRTVNTNQKKYYVESLLDSPPAFTGKDKSGKALPEAMYTYKLEAYVYKSSTTADDVWSFDVYLDTTAPKIDSVSYSTKYLTMTLSDAHYISGIEIFSSNDKKIEDVTWYAENPTQLNNGRYQYKNVEFSLDNIKKALNSISGASKDKVKVVVYDYAMNKSESVVSLAAGSTPTPTPQKTPTPTPKKTPTPTPKKTPTPTPKKTPTPTPQKTSAPNQNDDSWKNPFKDVTKSNWFYKDVAFINQTGLMNGVEKTVFGPNITVTRSMFVTILGRYAGINKDLYKGWSFVDVPVNSYYAPYVNWASLNSVVNGVGANRFAPEDPVTREQIALILSRYANNNNLIMKKVQGAAAFSDTTSLSKSSQRAVQELYQAGIINGRSSTKFDPKAKASRAEVAAMVHRFIKSVS